jgi:hypothetical protein
MHWTLPDVRRLKYSTYLDVLAWLREQTKARPE